MIQSLNEFGKISALYLTGRKPCDRTTLNRDIEASGLVQVGLGGILLKVLADCEMDRLIVSSVLVPYE